jgi:hypothetical protein
MKLVTSRGHAVQDPNVRFEACQLRILHDGPHDEASADAWRALGDFRRQSRTLASIRGSGTSHMSATAT